MSLKQYRQKRSFQRTPEPSGSGKIKPGHRFVVQKHDASHLHYDFRLELDGTLKSWAVPKGPSLDPAQKRLAIQVEDHPIEYGDFEGTIPQGEYGGGTVMVWDRGAWIPEGEGDPQTQYREGRLKFTLEGQKLHGSWALVRTARGDSRKPQWLLIKHNDAAARPGAKRDITETDTKSAKTGRSLEEIANGAPAPKNGKRRSRKKSDAAGDPEVWHSNRPSRISRRAEPGPVKVIAPARRSRIQTHALARLPGARQRSMPTRPQAELATLVAQPPEGDAWLHEIKFDGYRMFCCSAAADRIGRTDSARWPRSPRSCRSNQPCWTAKSSFWMRRASASSNCCRTRWANRASRLGPCFCTTPSTCCTSTTST
jgi:bifunctional non-homologous end joining protein LigD